MSTTAKLLIQARLAAGMSQRELAVRAGTSQPAVARLESGRSNATLGTLERLLTAAGFELRCDLVPRGTKDPVVEAYKRDVDRTLLRENLRRGVDERLRSNAELLEAGKELRRATRPRSTSS